MSSTDTHLDDEALELRRSVVGDAHVDAALAAADDFSRPIQEIITNHAWGMVWARPGLDLASRSLVTIGILAALNRPAELELHVAGALRNGCTVEQIRETLLHCAVYAGIPAAVDAFTAAGAILRQRGAESSPRSGQQPEPRS